MLTDSGEHSDVGGSSRALRLPVHTTEMYRTFSPDRSRLLTGGDEARMRRSPSGMSRPGIACTSLPAIQNRLRRSPGVLTSSGLSPARSINPCACGMSGQATAFLSWKGIDPMSAPLRSVSRARNCSQGPATPWSVSGRCQKRSCYRYSRVTPMGFTTPSSTRLTVDSCRAVETARSESGMSAPAAA